MIGCMKYIFALNAPSPGNVEMRERSVYTQDLNTINGPIVMQNVM